MSEVSALIIKDKKMRFVKSHYKKILETLNDSCDEDLDAGWIVVDYDKKVVISSQCAFSPVKWKDFEVYDI